MARQIGLNNFAGTLEVLAGGPLDARTVVPVKADLTTNGTFPYAYVGMVVAVQAEGKIYILTNMDYTNAANWTEIGAGTSGSDNVVEGYFNPANNLFYQESTFVNPIAGAGEVIYIDLSSNLIYRFNSPIFERLDNESNTVQVSVMPTASSSEEGNIYQYVGATGIYTNGYFYKCVYDVTTSTYIWEAINTQDSYDKSEVYNKNDIGDVTDLPDNTKDIVENICDLDQKVTDITQDITDINQDITDLQQDVNDIQQDVTDLQQDVTDINQDITNLQQDVTDLNQDMTDAKQDITDIKQDITDINQDITNLGQDITDINQDITDIKQDISDLENDKQDVIQFSTMPTAAIDLLGNIVQYTGVSTSDYINGYFYKCVLDGTAYKWENINVQPAGGATGGVDSVNGKTGTVIIDASDIGLQENVMPTADATNLGHIVQYSGATNTDYTHGCFYECVNDGSAYSWEKVDTTDISGKVDKNGTDRLMTAAEGTKLNGIESGAQVNVIESITVNGTAVSPDASKNVALTVITNTVNDLVNYYKKSETYTKDEVDAAIGAITGISFDVEPALPTTNIKTNVIYLIPKSTAAQDNIYDEYINLDGTSAGWELIGDTAIDLSGYVTTSDLNTTLADYVQTSDLNTLLADYVTNTELSTALADYVTDSELTTTLVDYVESSELSDYVTDTELNTTLDNYVETSDLSTVLADYVTNSDLSTALTDYVTETEMNTALGNYVESSDLSTILGDYVTETELGTALGDYVTSSDLNTTLAGYVESSELSNYVTTSDLNTTLGDYVETSDLNTTLADYVTETELGTALGDYVTDTELSTALADYTETSDLATVLGNKLIPSGGTTGQVLVKNSNADQDVVWDDVAGEYYLESSVTTTTGQTFSFTFTDAKLVPGAVIDIFAGQLNQTGTQTVYDYSSVSLSNGTCTISYPEAPSNATVTCRIYIK